jgi:isopenicillin N synthase-like dioxygenase
MSTSFSSIPILDLSLANSPSTRPELLADLRYALTQIGFLYIKNHTVNLSTVDDLVTALPSLFALSTEDKDSCALHNSPHFLGYSGFGSEWTANNVDLREQFEFGTPLITNDFPKDGELWTGLYGPNQVSATEFP